MSDQENNVGNGWLVFDNGNSSDNSDATSSPDSESDSEHETEDHSSSSGTVYHVNGNSTDRYHLRRERFLRMAYSLLHIESMNEFLMSAQIEDERELIRKYEDVLVRMDSAVSDYARKRHEARLIKKEQIKKFYKDSRHGPCESDVSTPTVSEEEPTILSDDEIANLSPISRIRYFQSVEMAYHVYLSE